MFVLAITLLKFALLLPLPLYSSLLNGTQSGSMFPSTLLTPRTSLSSSLIDFIQHSSFLPSQPHFTQLIPSLFSLFPFGFGKTILVLFCFICILSPFPNLLNICFHAQPLVRFLSL